MVTDDYIKHLEAVLTTARKMQVFRCELKHPDFGDMSFELHPIQGKVEKPPLNNSKDALDLIDEDMEDSDTISLPETYKPRRRDEPAVESSSNDVGWASPDDERE